VTDRALPGALVISIDLELRWGVRDHCFPGSPYERNLHGARDVVPRLLDLFKEFEVGATWATVGFLFASSKSELDEFRPPIIPGYTNPRLDPYQDQVGADERSDPLHFGASLVERIRATPRQEIATHTYSHYFCTESGQTATEFDADLRSAMAIADTRGIALYSIVFPRNQHNPDYDEVLRSHGIAAYRGNPDSWMWRFADAEQSAGRGKRAARFADSLFSVTGDGSHAWDGIVQPGGLADVRASFLVRPYSPSLRALEPLRERRLRTAISSAARRGRIVHLWWHPHNFGAYPDQCLLFLRRILEEFSRSRDRFGMRSMTMIEVARTALALSRKTAPAMPTAGVDESARRAR